MFVECCFIKAFDKTNVKKMIGGFSEYAPTSADQEFLKNDAIICHTGFVSDKDSKYAYIVEDKNRYIKKPANYF